MKKVFPTTKFKRDLKRYSKQKTKMEALLRIIDKLKHEEPIPPEYKPHILRGIYKGC